MTPAEYMAAKWGYIKEEELKLKLLAWQVYYTMPAVKRRPSVKKLYKSLTGKTWMDTTEDDDTAGKEKAVDTLRGMTKKGIANRKTPQQNAIDLGAHIFERRKNRLNGS